MQRCVSACNPDCGQGEVCTSEGRCVSACNPPCGSSQRCTSQGQCVSTAPPAPPATSAPPGWTFNPTASPAPPPSDVHHEDELAERERSGKRFHDGFYLRLGVGAGYLLSAATAQASDGGESASSSRDGGLLGFTVPVEFAIGGSPTPGVVIGGGAWGLHVPAGQYTVGRGDYAKTETASYGAMTMLGPFIDVYPAPRFGLHFQAAPGLALVNPGTSDTLVTSPYSGVGFGAMGGLGYEGWVSEQWGMGLLARLQFFTASMSNEAGDKYSLLALTPSILMTATLN